MHRATVLALSMSATALAQQQWSLRQTATTTPPVIGARMAYDALHSRTVLFGGTTRYQIPSPTFADTWLFDGVDWTLHNPAARPPSRAHHTLVFDSSYGQVILFGGIDGNGSPLNDLWEWDGTNWTANHQSIAPPPRGFAAAASTNYGSFTIVGGYDPHSQTWHGDMWSWSRFSGWGSAALGPPPRAGAAMVHLAHAQSYTLLLHGGRDAQRPNIAETWLLGSNGWQLLPQAGGPARDEPLMVYDRDSQQAFLTGGRGAATSSGYGDDLWRFDGQRWIEITPATRPAQTFAATCALDTARHAFQLHGGASDAALTTGTSQLWEFQSTFPVVRLGTSCAAVGPAPRLSVTVATTGSRLFIDLSCASPFPIAVTTLGFNGQVWNGMPLPVDLAFLGLPGCQAHLAPETVFVASLPPNTSNVGGWINIPARPSLAGMVFFVQGLAAEPARLRGVTDGVRCTIL